VVVGDVLGTYGAGPLTGTSSFGQFISAPVCVGYSTFGAPPELLSGY